MDHARPFTDAAQNMAAETMQTTGDDCLVSRIAKQTFLDLQQTVRIFSPHKSVRKVAVFGSARTRPGDCEYGLAEQVAALFVKNGLMVITGAGPGIMAAAQKGAGTENSFGLRILLPFENRVNETIKGDAKLVECKYFFTRKLSFVLASDAFVIFPGGLGTLDECFEILTLMQTGKMPIVPVVMLERPGGKYWETLRRFIAEELMQGGHVSPQDMNFFRIVRTIDDALGCVLGFYRNFHSCHWQEDHLSIFLTKRLSDGAIDRLNSGFSFMLQSGRIEQKQCSGASVAGDGAPQFCLSLTPHERHFGEIRMLIDAVNAETEGSMSA